MFLLVIVITLVSCSTTHTGSDIRTGQFVTYTVDDNIKSLLQAGDTIVITYDDYKKKYYVAAKLILDVKYAPDSFIVIFK